jgi:hypothetical protein
LEVKGSRGSTIVIKSELQEGQSIQDYAVKVLNHDSSCQSKAFYVCFQIGIKGTRKQLELCSNRKKVSKTAKEEYSGTWVLAERPLLVHRTVGQ